MDYGYVDSFLGSVMVVASERGLCRVVLPQDHRGQTPDPAWRRDGPLVAPALRQLRAYFEGPLRAFSLPYDVSATAFQSRVWRGLERIAYGRTTSYAALAQRIGAPRASRAVGTANGCNPLPIVVPCHRVIGSDGSLRGYACGLPAKRALLAHEARYCQR